MTINFTKMHGLGNDFIVIDTRFENVPDTEAVYRHLCDRKRGIGCDQLVLICNPRDEKSDLYVRLINMDGMEVGMCGNALRCVAGMFWDKVKRKSADTLVLATQSGHYPSRRISETQAEVLMGQAATAWQKIPLAAEQDYLNVTLANNLPVPKAGVMNIGNPHIVFVVPDAEAVPLAEWGPQIEYDAILPERANVEFIHIVDPHHIRMRVWERSAGITEACGSGACASAFIALQRGLVQSPVKVQMDGGVLDIRIDEDGMIYQSGPYATAFSGQADLENSQL
ncbi:MAG TPA: diaminopimelate epimerase [Alphaproteobacteria bacterium]